MVSNIVDGEYETAKACSAGENKIVFIISHDIRRRRMTFPAQVHRSALVSSDGQLEEVVDYFYPHNSHHHIKQEQGDIYKSYTCIHAHKYTPFVDDFEPQHKTDGEVGIVMK